MKTKIENSIKKAVDSVDNAILCNQSMLVYDLQQNNCEDFEYNVKITFEAIKDYCYENDVEKFLIEANLISCDSSFNQEIFEEFEEEICDFVESETDLRYQMQDHYESWIVAPWLLARLEELGELVVDYKSQEQWWGRKCTGQSIKLDYVIQEITKELAARFAKSCVNEIEDFLNKNNLQTFNL